MITITQSTRSVVRAYLLRIVVDLAILRENLLLAASKANYGLNKRERRQALRWPRAKNASGLRGKDVLRINEKREKILLLHCTATLKRKCRLFIQI
jgi:hypothetical protein